MNRNSCGDKGHPWATPDPILNWWLFRPFIFICLIGGLFSLYIVPIHLLVSSFSPILSIAFLRNSHEHLSNAFSIYPRALAVLLYHMCRRILALSILDVVGTSFFFWVQILSEVLKLLLRILFWVFPPILSLIFCMVTILSAVWLVCSFLSLWGLSLYILALCLLASWSP